MKRFLLALFVGVLFHASFGQTIVFHENFDTPSLADSVITGANGTSVPWSINNTLQVSPTNSYHGTFAQTDSSWVETNSFSTSGNTFVILEFDHIAKIAFFDFGIVQVSNNGGANWTTLNCPQYLGSGNFCNSGNKFASNVYLDWLPAQAGAVPTNAWWKHETFDVSSLLANSTNCKVRWLLYDANNNGMEGNYGWLLDNIKVTAAPSELNPPVIVLVPPVFSGPLSSTGPYNINATITDASGIDTAMVIYSFNNAPDDTVAMVHTGNNNYLGILPAAAIGDTFCFRVYAVDQSPAANWAVNPTGLCQKFWVVPVPPIIQIGNGTVTNTGTTYPAPYGHWFRGARHQMLILASELTAAGVNGAVDFQSLQFNVITANGVPLNNFTIKMGNYTPSTITGWTNTGLTTVYTVANYTDVVGWNLHQFQTPFQWDGVSNVLVETCFNNWPDPFSNNAVFQQTQFSSNRTIVYNSDGDQNLCSNPNSFANGYPLRPNMKFEVGSPQPNDVGIISVESPLAFGCDFSAAELVTVKMKNIGLDSQDTIPVAYQINGGPIQRDTIYQLINSGDTLVYTFSQTANLSAPGTYNFTIWTQLPGDFGYYNDTLYNHIVINTLTSIPYTQNFDSWPNGMALADNWLQETSDLTNWEARQGATLNANTGPSADHTSGNGKYIFTYGPFTGFVNAGVTTPCFDFTNLIAPKLEFWYHMWGNQIGTLKVEALDTNGAWIQVWSLTGNQGNQWVKATVNLSQFAGSYTKLRWNHTGVAGGAQQDAAIDDIFIYEPQPNDVGVIAFTEPVQDFCGYSATEDVTVRVFNFGTLPQDTIPVAYRVNGGAPIWDTIHALLNPGDTINFTFSTTANLSTTGQTYTFQGWTNLPGEQNVANDSLGGYAVVHNTAVSTFPYTENFESFTAGSGSSLAPGTLQNNWSRTPNTTAGSAIYYWLVQTGPTVTFGTGPNGDNTPGLNGNGKYMYTEANGGTTGNVTTLVSPCLDFTALTTPYVRFYYHRFGAQNPTFYLDVNIGNGWVPVDSITGGNQTSNAAPYLERMVNLSMAAGHFTKVRWRAISTGCCAGDMAIDDVTFFEPQALDAGVTAVLLPANQAPSGTSLNVQVQLRNFGTTTLTSIPVAYTVNGGAPVVQTWTGSLAPYAFTTFSFTTPYNAPTNTYSLCAYTILPSDGDLSNDTTCKSLVGVATIVPPYFDNFESGAGSWSSSGGFNQWQYGVPAANVINSAYSPVNAWVVNLTGIYQNNSNDDLLTPYFNFAGLYNTELRFRHYYHTEPSWDGGRIDYTLNNGATWAVLGSQNSPLGTNWYNSASLNSSQQPGWMNNSFGWVLSTFDLGQFDNSSSLVRFRFKFTSDASLNNYNGWGIDDFEIFVPIQRSMATTELLVGSTNAFILPALNVVSAYVYNTGVVPITSCNATLAADGVNLVTDNLSFSTPLQPNDSVFHTFSVQWQAAPGAHEICVYTSNPNGSLDEYVADDTTCVTVTVLDSISGFPYCNNFDGADPLWLTLNAFSFEDIVSWELGTPNKVVLNDAFSGDNCWVTGISNTYFQNDSSALYTPIFNVNTNNCYRVSFKTKYFTEEYQDGGTVEYSHDLINWTRIGNAFDPMWFDSQFILGLGSFTPGTPGWSGTSAGWQSATHDVKFDVPGSVIVRFRFGSDSNVEMEGWAIDDFCFEELPPCIISVNEFEPNFQFGEIYPNPSAYYAQLEFNVPDEKAIFVQIQNTLGQTVYAQDLKTQAGNNKLGINTSELANGIYYLRTEYDGYPIVRKFVVSR